MQIYISQLLNFHMLHVPVNKALIQALARVVAPVGEVVVRVNDVVPVPLEGLGQGLVLLVVEAHLSGALDQTGARHLVV